MPDPRDPTPVRAEKRGNMHVLVDASGKKMAGRGAFSDDKKAQVAADKINESWALAKKVCVSRGGPAITEASVHFDANLHPRDRVGKFRDVLNGLSVGGRAHIQGPLGRVIVTRTNSGFKVKGGAAREMKVEHAATAAEKAISGAGHGVPVARVRRDGPQGDHGPLKHGGQPQNELAEPGYDPKHKLPERKPLRPFSKGKHADRLRRKNEERYGKPDAHGRVKSASETASANEGARQLAIAARKRAEKKKKRGGKLSEREQYDLTNPLAAGSKLSRRSGHDLLIEGDSKADYPEAMKCPEGHKVPKGAKKCPTCGYSMKLHEAVEARKAAADSGDSVAFTSALARERQLREELALEERARYPHVYHFDPRQHPRDRLGKFAQVLASLKKDGRGSDILLPHGISVTRSHTSFNVAVGGKKVGRHMGVEQAAAKALLHFDKGEGTHPFRPFEVETTTARVRTKHGARFGMAKQG